MAQLVARMAGGHEVVGSNPTTPTMEKTEIYEDLNKPVIGYLVNAGLSLENQQKICALQADLQREIGDALWWPPPVALHITLMDWLAPLVDYHEDKDVLFDEIFAKYDQALERSLRETGPITVSFNSVRASTQAIYVKGIDDGQFQKIRSEFLKEVTLLPNTKQPPEIIHFTLGRFTEAIDIEQVRSILNEKELIMSETVSMFRLARETKPCMMERSIIKTYSLS